VQQQGQQKNAIALQREFDAYVNQASQKPTAIVHSGEKLNF
jgi:hypothetical protein